MVIKGINPPDWVMWSHLPAPNKEHFCNVSHGHSDILLPQNSDLIKNLSLVNMIWITKKHHKTTSQPKSVGIYISITYWKPSPEAKVHKLLPGLEGLQILALLGRSAAAACRQLGERRLGLAAVHAADTLNVAWQSAPKWLLKQRLQQKMLWIRMILHKLRLQYNIYHMIVIFIPTYIPYF